MRVRITHALNGSIDGIQLSRFRVGEVYDMGTSLANYLMACGFAMPVVDEGPALVIPLDRAHPEERRRATWGGTQDPAESRDTSKQLPAHVRPRRVES
jgi:hypothetical protein